jgi:hypothetical protein
LAFFDKRPLAPTFLPTNQLAARQCAVGPSQRSAKKQSH